MKYKVGDRVRIQPLEWYQKELESAKYYLNIFDIYWCSREMTISKIEKSKYLMEEDGQEFYWTDKMIEGLVEEDVDLIPKFGEYSDNEPLDVPTMTTEFIKEIGVLPCPEGYQFVDENGNVINATKIVLEKKKKEYPKTYDECCKVLNIAVRDLDILDNMLDTTEIIYSKNLDRLLNSFRKLIICRDAYWKIAGEEMGLGKPWEPENPTKHYIFTIENCGGDIVKNTITYKWRNRILAFPTAEMRDAFYENFKELIEQCKELL